MYTYKNLVRVPTLNAYHFSTFHISRLVFECSEELYPLIIDMSL